MPTERRTLLTPIELLPPKIKRVTMARPTIEQQHTKYIHLASELVSNICRGGDLERSLVRDLRELDDDKRSLTLGYAVKQMLQERKEEVMAALAAQLAQVDETEKAERAAKAQQAAKAEALTRLATHAHVKAKARRIVKGRGK